MNKMIKGSIAGATGVALLMGGFGTYAVWSDESVQPGDAITSGNLDVQANAVSWTDNATPANTLGDVDDWNFLMVPGDVVTRTQTFTFTGAGRNLTGAIRFAPGAETEPQKAAAGSSLADSFDIDVAVTGMTLTEAPGGNCWDFTTSGLPQTATTKVKYELTADDQDLQNATAEIASSTFTILQNDAC